MWDLYRDFEEEDEVNTMLDVVKTTCSLCGSPMEWHIGHTLAIRLIVSTCMPMLIVAAGSFIQSPIIDIKKLIY